jgi:predicted phage terminase large subunit-like protein
VSALAPPIDFIPALSPRFMRPTHLAPLLGLFERIAAGEQVRAVISVPPRFAKTESLLHSLVWLLLLNPELQVIFASYAARLAETKSRRARTLAATAGVPLADDARSRANWRTSVGDGGMWATGVDGALTGIGGNVIVVDDIHKGRAEAESATIRESIWSWFKSDLTTRAEPGASIIVNGTRWHPEDLPGRLIAEGWEAVNLEALTPAGESLWPERWPAAALLKICAELGGPESYEWTSLYCGRPRGRGSRAFGDCHFYDERPATFEALSIGLDFAYSTRTHADWSAAVLVGRHAGKYYVIDVVRARLEPREFRARVQAMIATWPAARAAAYHAATELGGIEFMRDGGISVDARTATIDKFSRAIPTVAAWNQGSILLPRSAPWSDAFVSEIASFTGTKADRHDDQIDALAAAFDSLNGGAWQSPDWSFMAQAAALVPPPFGGFGNGGVIW